MAPLPTHHAKHFQGWRADIYIADTLLYQLNHGTPAERKRAQDSLCIRFRKACIANYGDSWARGHNYVNWVDFRIVAIETQPASRIDDDDDDDDGECDDCPSCDIGYHERCRQPSGCPNAALR